ATGSSAAVAVCKDRRAWNIITWITWGCANGFTARRARCWPRPSIMRACRPSPRSSMPPRCARTSWTASATASRIASSPGARWRAVCRGISPFCAANASPTGAAPAISTRNGSPALGRLKKIEPVIYYSGGLLSDRTTLRTNNYDLSRSQPRQERENLGHQRQSFIKLLAGMKSNRAGNVRKSACAVPEADNLNLFVVTPQPINDAIGAENNFAQFGSPEFRQDAPAFWKSFQRQRRIKQLVAHAFGGEGIVGRNVGDDALQIIQRVGGEEYFEIHCGMRWRASSKGMRSPRSSDASPSSTACRNSSS